MWMDLGYLYLRQGHTFSICPRIWVPRRVRLIADHSLAQNLLRCVVGRQAAVRKSWGFMDKR